MAAMDDVWTPGAATPRITAFLLACAEPLAADGGDGGDGEGGGAATGGGGVVVAPSASEREDAARTLTKLCAQVEPKLRAALPEARATELFAACASMRAQQQQLDAGRTRQATAGAEILLKGGVIVAEQPARLPASTFGRSGTGGVGSGGGGGGGIGGGKRRTSAYAEAFGASRDRAQTAARASTAAFGSVAGIARRAVRKSLIVNDARSQQPPPTGAAASASASGQAAAEAAPSRPARRVLSFERLSQRMSRYSERINRRDSTAAVAVPVRIGQTSAVPSASIQASTAPLQGSGCSPLGTSSNELQGGIDLHALPALPKGGGGGLAGKVARRLARSQRSSGDSSEGTSGRSDRASPPPLAVASCHSNGGSTEIV